MRLLDEHTMPFPVDTEDTDLPVLYNQPMIRSVMMVCQIIVVGTALTLAVPVFAQKSKDPSTGQQDTREQPTDGKDRMWRAILGLTAGNGSFSVDHPLRLPYYQVDSSGHLQKDSFSTVQRSVSQSMNAPSSGVLAGFASNRAALVSTAYRLKSNEHSRHSGSSHHGHYSLDSFSVMNVSFSIEGMEHQSEYETSDPIYLYQQFSFLKLRRLRIQSGQSYLSSGIGVEIKIPDTGLSITPYLTYYGARRFVDLSYSEGRFLTGQQAAQNPEQLWFPSSIYDADMSGTFYPLRVNARSSHQGLQAGLRFHANVSHWWLAYADIRSSLDGEFFRARTRQEFYFLPQAGLVFFAEAFDHQGIQSTHYLIGPVIRYRW